MVKWTRWALLAGFLAWLNRNRLANAADRARGRLADRNYPPPVRAVRRRWRALRY